MPNLQATRFAQMLDDNRHGGRDRIAIFFQHQGHSRFVNLHPLSKPIEHQTCRLMHDEEIGVVAGNACPVEYLIDHGRYLFERDIYQRRTVHIELARPPMSFARL